MEANYIELSKSDCKTGACAVLNGNMSLLYSLPMDVGLLLYSRDDLQPEEKLDVEQKSKGQARAHPPTCHCYLTATEI